jgi:DNA-binding IclR family transcriptional regulator
VRRDGYATENGEVTPGFASVAAAVLDHAGHPIAAVASTFADREVDAAQRAQLADRVRDTAARLTRRMSGTGN